MNITLLFSYMSISYIVPKWSQVLFKLTSQRIFSSSKSNNWRNTKKSLKLIQSSYIRHQNDVITSILVCLVLQLNSFYAMFTHSMVHKRCLIFLYIIVLPAQIRFRLVFFFRPLAVFRTYLKIQSAVYPQRIHKHSRRRCSFLVMNN